MWKYTGSGEYFPGVPARDLTDEEYAAAKDLIEGLDTSPLYKRAPDPARAESKDATAKEGGT
jgi:hypothetical protein